MAFRDAAGDLRRAGAELLAELLQLR